MGAEDSHKYALFTYMLEELNKLDKLAYVHMASPLPLCSCGRKRAR